LFCAGGLVDVMMKAFDEAFADQHSRALFLLLVFGVALLIGLVLVVGKGVRTGVWPDRATWVWGLFLGLFNYGSAEFLLRAIEELSGPFVFPANSIALVIGGALLGIFVWGEHLSRLNWLGLACAALALVLLNL
jgi:drug/metabolite transporter (DMT)-like permease